MDKMKEIIQYFRDTNEIYRKKKLNNFFGWQKNCFLPYRCEEKTYLFFSEPNKFFGDDYNFVLDYLNDPNKIIIYDRTDNWTGHKIIGEKYKILEDVLLKETNVIICSSKWLYNQTKKEAEKAKVFYVPNGNDHFDYINKEKEKIAIYGGAKMNKVNLDSFIELASNNKDWKIKIYCNDFIDFSDKNEFFILDNLSLNSAVTNDKFFEECCKAKVGLCLLNEDDWTVGMLPNKVFLYSMAKIPCVFSGVPDENLEDYDFCIKYSKDLNLNEIADKKYNFIHRDWNNVCKEISDILEREILCN